jgi:hypothetical protein
MTIYTESTLDSLEQGVETKKRSREAGRKFLLMPEGERSYGAVAKTMLKGDGTPITEPRAAVYVREYLEAIGKKDEALTGRRSSNGGTGNRAITTGNGMLDATLAMREQWLAEQDRVANIVTEATEAVDTFDATEWIEETAEHLREQLAEVQARLDAWTENKDNIATESADQYRADLTKRRDDVNKQSGDALEHLNKQVDLANSTLKMIVGMDDSALKAIEEQNKDLATEIAEAIGIEPATVENPTEA